MCDANEKLLLTVLWLKVLESYFSFLFLMERSILYTKIIVSQKLIFFKIQF